MIIIKKYAVATMLVGLCGLLASPAGAHERVYHPQKNDRGNADKALYDLSHPWPFRGGWQSGHAGAASHPPMRDMRGELEAELIDTGVIKTAMVHFEFDRATITPESEQVLDHIGSLLADWPGIEVEVSGYADDTGPGAYNQGLSERRARAVQSYLAERFPNLQDRLVAARGYGESNPVAENTTRAGRAQNRRVEFKVVNEEEFEKAKERRARR